MQLTWCTRYLQQMKEEGTQADQGGMLASNVVNGVQSAPEAGIHAAEHGGAAGLVCKEIAQRRSIVHQTPAITPRSVVP